jgi:hypothetical protein
MLKSLPGRILLSRYSGLSQVPVIAKRSISIDLTPYDVIKVNMYREFWS